MRIADVLAGMQDLPQEVCELFDDLIGKPFKFGGRGPDFFDCFGLAREVYRRLGRNLPDFYSPTEDCKIHEAIKSNEHIVRRLDGPEPYCLATFWLRRPKYTQHIGVVLPNCYEFIHILSDLKVVIERFDCDPWKRRVTGFFAWDK